MARHMDQIDIPKRHARRSDAIPPMLASFLSCAHQQTTSILSHCYGCCTPLGRAASTSFAMPGTHMLAYLRAWLLNDTIYAVGCFCLQQPLGPEGTPAQDVASTPLGSCGTLLLLVCGFAALCAAKPHTEDGSTMLPQAESAPNAGNRVTRINDTKGALGCGLRERNTNC